jgi:peptidoglycan/xylan/chitin deacetylase (PgdA/CDA1 family)
MGLPATFFLTGASLSGEVQLWWSGLERIAHEGPGAWGRLHDRLRRRWPWIRQARAVTDVHELRDTIENMPPGERDAIVAEIQIVAGSGARDSGLPAAAVRAMATRGFEIGFHTRDHYSLQTLDENELRRAMRRGVSELEAAAGHRLTAIAYPHCRADLRVAQAASDAGFTLGFVCGDRPITPHRNPLLLDRIDGWSSSLGRFAVRLARAVAREG